MPPSIASSAALPADPGPDRLSDALADDMTPLIAALGRGVPFALATLVAREGGPRPVGSQMLVTADRRWGFLSGGCVEDDVAAHARETLRDHQPRRLTYGRDSPFFDIRLPCGGRIDVLVEAVPPGDAAIVRLLDLTARRRPARYRSDGVRRRCRAVDEAPVGDWPADRPASHWTVDRVATPIQRLIVVGADPFALAIAVAGAGQGWPVWLIGDGLPAGCPLAGVTPIALPPGPALAGLGPDAWTAIAVATHDPDLGEAALAAALRSDAGYVGALGSRRRLQARRQVLADAGVSPTAMARLHAPIGLPIGATSPRGIAAAVVAEIIAHRA